MTDALDHAHDLCDFVGASPSPYHAAAELSRRLAGAGFVQQREVDPWAAGSGFVVRDGAVIAWRLPADAAPTTPFRIVGAHTDSPTFKLKPRPDLANAGWQQLGVEVYGGPLLNSWLDRELGLAGRLVLISGEHRLVRTEAIMRIPQLAIHLDRGVNDEGLKLDKQQHLSPVWGVDRRDLRILSHLAETVGVVADDVAGWDVVAFDTAAPAIFGTGQEFLASARLDNLSGVHAGLSALIEAPAAGAITVLAAFDHEEVGSETRSGAAGPFLADVLGRISYALGAGPDERRRALAGSVCLSIDAGHAVHPNYAGRHDPANHPLLGGGPLLKLNANQRYATDAVGAALWRRACRTAGVDTQEFVSNNAIPCGSTIGPITATRLGIRTVDVGLPLLSMHSARELAGTADPLALARGAAAFLAGA
ncbi:M18 family aminopeptidase [Microlunatus ginsengisoli]|uniref:M18 family aminopeptidase n=1 Tax=Microlunatus ginsengisoli TaxID=363863 RepID=A0ABP7ASN8_9ACTN